MKSVMDAAKLAGAGTPPIGLEALAQQFGQNSPVSISNLVALMEAPPLTIRQDVVTPSGTALGGWVEMTLRSDGSYTFNGHMHDSGWDPYDFRVRAVISVNDVAVAAQHGGHTDGTGSAPFGSPNRDNDWSESGTESRIQLHWAELRQATMTVNFSYQDAGVLHAVEDLFNDFLGFLVGSAVFGPHLAELLVIGNELGEMTGLKFGSPSYLDGILVTALDHPAASGASVFLFGPGIVMPVIAAGIANAPRHRPMSDDEIGLASKVFGDTLPTDRIVLTDMKGLNCRAFTFPNIDGTILVNLGDAYDDAKYRDDCSPYTVPGQLLIHELTHAWQIAHQWFIAGWMCDALNAQIVQGQSAYIVRPAGPPWHEFGIEEQARAVDRWFGQYASGWNSSGAFEDQLKTLETKLDGPAAVADPYFGYIANNIRLGQS